MSVDRTTRIDRVLPGLFVELADAKTPDYLEAAIEHASSRPQRPAWTFPGRWIPMEITTRVASTTHVPWRPLGALAVIALLVAILAATLILGPARSNLAPPFGRAGNGVVAFDDGGDIMVADPTSGDVRTLIGGPDEQRRPVFSPDGSKVAFQRAMLEPDQLPGSSSPVHIEMAAADGSGVTTLTSAPIRLSTTGAQDQYRFSPDGRWLAVAGSDGDVGGILLARTDGSDTRWLDLQLPDGILVLTRPAFHPVDGREILVVGGGPDTALLGGTAILAIDPDDGSIRQVAIAAPDHLLDEATWSPDGSKVAYHTWDTRAADLSTRVRVIGSDGSLGTPLPLPAGAIWDVGAAWSNDGTQLFVVRGYTGGHEDTRAAIVPSDGSGTGTEVGYGSSIMQECCFSWAWSPDDSMVLGNPIGADAQPRPQTILEVATGIFREAAWTSSSAPQWQRVAP